jgi:hypothetical protein
MRQTPHLTSPIPSSGTLSAPSLSSRLCAISSARRRIAATPAVVADPTAPTDDVEISLCPPPASLLVVAWLVVVAAPVPPLSTLSVSDDGDPRGGLLPVTPVDVVAPAAPPVAEAEFPFVFAGPAPWPLP